jgi:hypothetical protein
MLQWSTLGAALHGAARAAREASELPPAIAAIDPDDYAAISRAVAELPEGSRHHQFRDGLEQLLRSAVNQLGPRYFDDRHPTVRRFYLAAFRRYAQQILDLRG